MTFNTRTRYLMILAVVALLTAPALAQEATQVADASRAPDSTSAPALPTTLDEARSRIGELENRIAVLKSELAAAKAASATNSASVTPTPTYAVDIESDQMRFLNLGVSKNYIGAERDRLVDQLHTMIPPLYEPAFSPFHGYTLPPHAFRVAVNSDRFVNEHDFGTDKFYSLFFNKVKVQNQGVDVDFLYGLTANNTLRVVVPLRSTIISGTGHPYRIQPMVMSMNGTAFGLGDVQVMLKHKWFDQGYKRFSFATVAGIQFPSGKNDAKFNDAQTLVMNGVAMPVSSSSGGPKVDLFSDDLRINNGAQPGTGAWGAMVGVMGTRQLTWNRFRGAIHGGALYKAMKEVDGIRPGNELLFALSFVRPPTPSEHFTFDLTFFGRNKQAELYPGTIMHPEADANGMPIMNPDGSLKMFVTPRPPFEHGTVMFLSPSLVIIPKSALRLTVSPLVRVYEPNQGPSPAFRLVFGATTTF